MSFTDTIHVRLRPSRILRVTSLLVHVAALAVLIVLACHRPSFAALAVCVIVSGVYADRRIMLRRSSVITRLRWGADHALYWQGGDGVEHRGRCTEAKSWGALWVRLRAREAGRRWPWVFIIPFDAVEPDVHRRLRGRCRTMPPGPGSGPGT
ncbi:protein YgfX [Salinisphaera sp.]|uniref:protein YgfX n=1 Tax=Salinisphaera sp. TaxID=1914330 RepID=UPI002D795919|nr:protein YgfX [Salinisphaera sp.]HET7314869.1 protein YgfX [Salinisphaera sp.]